MAAPEPIGGVGQAILMERAGHGNLNRERDGDSSHRGQAECDKPQRHDARQCADDCASKRPGPRRATAPRGMIGDRQPGEKANCLPYIVQTEEGIRIRQRPCPLPLKFIETERYKSGCHTAILDLFRG